MPLRNNNIGIFGSSAAGGGGGGCCGIMSLGLCSGFGINIFSSANPLTSSISSFCVQNACPYLGQSVEVLGTGVCSTIRCQVNNTASGCYSAGLGGNNNTITTSNSSVVGGNSNVVCAKPTTTASNSFIGAGCKNTISSSNSTIVGGLCNNAFFIQNVQGAAIGVTILGGYCGNVVSNVVCNAGYGSFVGGGFCNSYLANTNTFNTGCYGVVFGGFANRGCNCISTIGGGCNNQNNTSVSTILGGCGNRISVGGCSAIGGGYNNQNNSAFSTIVGGKSNTLTINDSTSNIIIGGQLNAICTNLTSTNSFIGGGSSNLVCTFLSSINGGIGNTISLSGFNASSSFINGGCGNRTQSQNSVIVGGNNIWIRSNSCFSSVLGGNTIVANGFFNNVENVKNYNVNGGNYPSTHSSYNSNICCVNSVNNDVFYNELNGNCNCIFGQGLCFNTIQNGTCNYIISSCVCQQYGLILNGNLNCIENTTYIGSYNTIVNGESNYIGDSKISFIGGGICNNLVYALNGFNAFGSAIVGGVANNSLGGDYDATNLTWNTNPTFSTINNLTFVGGGQQNNAIDQQTSVVGGFCNVNRNCLAFIGGGFCNTIECRASQRSDYANVFGGLCNKVFLGQYDSRWGFIGGGECNCLTDLHNVIVGGLCNKISFIGFDQFTGNCKSFIGGGQQNSIYDCQGVIFGGKENIIYLGESSVIYGGCKNEIGCNVVSPSYAAYSTFSFIGGGVENRLQNNNDYSAILGAYNCTNADVSDVFLLGCCFGQGLRQISIANTTYVENLNIFIPPTDCTLNPTCVYTLGRDINTRQVVQVSDGLICFGLQGINCVDGTLTGLCFYRDCGGGTCVNFVCGSGQGAVFCMDLGKSGANDYLTGAGNVAQIPNVSSGGGVVYYMNGSCSQTGTGLTSFFQLSSSPIVGGSSTNFTRTNTGILSSFITPSGSPNLTIVPNGIWIISTYMSVSSNDVCVQPSIYSYDGTSLTLVSTGNKVLINTTNKSLYTMSVPFNTALTYPSTTRFALQFCVTDSAAGRTVCQFTEDDNLGAVSTTFPSGLGTLNSLICPTQVFQTTTDGTNFNIVSNTCTHCFNLPTASATNRGALSSADWSRFNGCLSSTYNANSFRINKLSCSATSQFFPYCFYRCCGFDETRITWVGGASPSNGGAGTPAGDIEYAVARIGNLVYFCMTGYYGKPGNTTTGFSINMPSGVGGMPNVCTPFMLPPTAFGNTPQSMLNAITMQGRVLSTNPPSWICCSGGGLNGGLQNCGITSGTETTLKGSIQKATSLSGNNTICVTSNYNITNVDYFSFSTIYMTCDP